MRRLLHTAAAAAVLGVPPGRIRRWAHRGWLPRRGTDAQGRTLYDLGEVHATERQVRERVDATSGNTLR